jgi:hypothetical protein
MGQIYLLGINFSSSPSERGPLATSLIAIRMYLSDNDIFMGLPKAMWKIENYLKHNFHYQS